MSEALQLLLQHPGFPEGTAWKHVQFESGTQVFEEGSRGYEVYLVLSGNVRVRARATLDDDRAVQPGVKDLGPGEVFGEMALFDHSPRSGTVTALDDCVLAVISGRHLRAFLDSHPELGYAVLKDFMQTMVARLRTANQRVSSLFAWGMQAHGVDDTF